ncbi:hypothetical protein OH492_28100 [Vibrio chagasii]|nr:hypothetical protein [Vibrio chagasii]
MASILKETTGGARAYRYGGEEFTIIFKGKHTEQVKRLPAIARFLVHDYDMTIRNTKSDLMI